MTYSATNVFLLTPTTQALVSLRRFDGRIDAKCSGAYSYHNAVSHIGICDVTKVPCNMSGTRSWVYNYDLPPRPADDDPRWPAACECGYQFTSADEYQINGDLLYLRGDTGALITLREAPPGAMWDAEWMHDLPEFCGFDGRCLMVRCPNGRDWHIDGRASNCTMPEEWTHRCWIRHGAPPNITVDKNGPTCQAGAGSIQAGDYHGFLQNGVLTAG